MEEVESKKGSYGVLVSLTVSLSSQHVCCDHPGPLLFHGQRQMSAAEASSCTAVFFLPPRACTPLVQCRSQSCWPKNRPSVSASSTMVGFKFNALSSPNWWKMPRLFFVVGERKSRNRSGWTSCPLKTRPPPQPAPGASVALNGPLHGSQFYDPVLSSQKSRYRSPSKGLLHAVFTSAPLWALKETIISLYTLFASLLICTCLLVVIFRKGVRPQRQVGNYLTLNWTRHSLPRGRQLSHRKWTLWLN